MNRLLFTVGPVAKKDRKSELPYFRTAEFSQINKKICNLFKETINMPKETEVIPLSCSGTGAMEALFQGVFDADDFLLIINGGTFGERFVKLADRFNIKYDEVKLMVGEQISENKLRGYLNDNVTHLLVNMHETSTGILYDMNILSTFCQKNNISLCVDAISSYLSDDIDFIKMQIDAIIVSSHKALGLHPGLSLIGFSNKIREKIMKTKQKSMYFDLQYALKNIERGQTPFTPSIGILLDLYNKLIEIKKVGVSKLINETAEKANYFRQGIESLPLKRITNYPSNAITSLKVNEDKSASLLNKKLIEDFNIYINPNGNMEDKVFRVAHIGEQSKTDIDRLILALKKLNVEGVI